jgi:hypothetical protein
MSAAGTKGQPYYCFSKAMEESHDFQMPCNIITGDRRDDRRSVGASSRKLSESGYEQYRAQGWRMARV